VFCRLLAADEEKGFTDVVLDGFVSAHSEYVRNTAIVTTVLTDKDGGAVRITDFAPRFQNFERTFRPPQIMRIIEPVAGLPRITDPLPADRSARQDRDAARVRQQPHPLHRRRRRDPAHHRRAALLCGPRGAVRVVAPAQPGVRRRHAVRRRYRHHLPRVLRPHPRQLAGMAAPAGDFLRMAGRGDARRDHAETIELRGDRRDHRRAYHARFRKRPGSGRTWDYRFCWLRDAYFVVRSLNRIGATRTMEDYISYILTIVSGHTGELQPVYNIISTDPLEERIVPDLKGYRGDGPVRIGNAAVAQNQHDTYGSAILAATPMFFDRRLPRMADENLFRRLEPLGEWCVKLAFEPDAGIWEYRGRKRIHTHSVSMCWAGCQRLEAIAAHLGLDDRAAYWGGPSDPVRDAGKAGIENAARFTAAFGSETSTQVLLAVHELGAVEATDPRFVSTSTRWRELNAI
jgi:hypothetical protein